MSMVIVEECISCGACEPECPNTAIAAGDPVYVVNADLCTECVGAFDAPQCVTTCPVENCIIPDPAHPESHEELDAKYHRLHG
jgi:ferredoxin